MKKTLTKISSEIFHYKDGVRIEGIHADISGDVNGIYGDVSGIYGNVSGIRGDVSDIIGNVSDIRGDLDDCEITDEDREKGINIKDLIRP